MEYLLDTFQAELVLIDQEGKIVEIINPNYVESTVGLPFKALFHSLYFAEIDFALQQIFQLQKDYTKDEIIVITGFFESKAVTLKLTPLQFQDENYALAVIADNTVKTHLKQALDESEKTLNALIATAVDGIITIDQRGTILTVNPSASRLFGYEPTEIIGLNVNVLMPEPDRSSHNKYMHNYQSTGHAKIIGIGREVTGRKKDGSTFPFSLGVSEVRLPNKVFYTGIIHDLTDYKLYEERLRRIAEDLRRSNRELEDFAYVSSHDLQEPLRKIQAFGDRIKVKDYEHISDTSKDYLDRMLNASARMQRLINDLLEFSRISSKARPFEPVDLNETLQNVLSDLVIAIEKSGATFEYDTLPIIEADPTQMHQLLQNLIANAIKFVAEGVHPHIVIAVREVQKQKHLTATPGDEYIEISVKDNGIGFDTSYSDKIFNIFQRLEGKKYEGSGIGLSVCKRIANRHGGDIKAESEVGKGSTFIIKLATKQT